MLEGEEDNYNGKELMKTTEEYGQSEGWGVMSILSACITVASAGIADAGIDCVDLVTGGVAATVCQPSMDSTVHSRIKSNQSRPERSITLVKDPCPAEHEEILAACVVGYLQSRDEITEIWVKGDVTDHFNKQSSDGTGLDSLMDQAIESAMATRLVLVEAVKESTELKMQKSNLKQI